MKNFLLLFLFPILYSQMHAQEPVKGRGGISVIKIWDSAGHNAFTDLIFFKSAFYVSFREGSGHMPGTDGKARVIRSVDGSIWESVALLEKEGIDLRDPKLSITADGRIMVTIGGSVYDRTERSKLLAMYPHVSFADASGLNFSEPQKVAIDPEVAGGKNWIWRVTWYKGLGYGIDYGTRIPYLLKTTDGKQYTKVSRLDISDYPNESTVRFGKNDTIYVLVRREEGDQKGVIAKSVPPYTNWAYTKINLRLGGPNFIFHGDKMIIGSRLYEQGGPSTGVAVTDWQGAILKNIALPSSGDNSYPGMLIHDGKLWFTYYSSHEGKTSIYLAKIELKELNP